jgi:DNA invertase Pin-like site-specific DNA recombinase
MKQLKKAVIYCRVSTKEQAEEGNSLNSQLRLCKEYAIKNHYEVVAEFIEQGESAKTADRPQLQQLLSFCSVKKNGIDAVIAYKIDRISRNTDDYSQIRLLLKRYKVEIKSTTEYFEDTPAGRFMENIIANVAQFDNDVRTERAVGGMREAVREGRYVWYAPIGYTNQKVGGKSTIVLNNMAPLVKEAFELVATGTYSIDEVRRIITKKGLSLRKGKPVAKSYFHKLLRNKLYAGYIDKFGMCIKGRFEPLITDALFKRVQWVLKHRTKPMVEYKTNNPDFPLRRFISHPSGVRLTGGWSKGNTAMYPYYRFPIPKMNFLRDDMHARFSAFMDNYALERKWVSQIKRYAKRHYQKCFDESVKEKKAIELRKKELLEQLNTLCEKNHKGFISDTVLQHQSVAIENEINKIEDSLAVTQYDIKDPESAIVCVEEFLVSPGNVWLKSDFNTQLRLQEFKFPKGVSFDGKIFTTSYTALFFKLNELNSTTMSPKVHFSFRFLNSFINECSTLGTIIKNKD